MVAITMVQLATTQCKINYGRLGPDGNVEKVQIYRACAVTAVTML